MQQLRRALHFEIRSRADHASAAHAGSRPASSMRFQCAADSKVAAMASPPDFIRTRTSISSSMAGTMLSRLVERDVAPDVDWARCQAGGVAESTARERQSVFACAFTDQVHQRAGDDLRQMAQIRNRVIVRFRRHDVHTRPEPVDEARQALDNRLSLRRPV